MLRAYFLHEHIGSCKGRGQLDKYWHGLKMSSRGRLVRASCPCCQRMLSCPACMRLGRLGLDESSGSTYSSSDDGSWHGGYPPLSLPEIPHGQRTGRLQGSLGRFHPTQYWARELRKAEAAAPRKPLVTAGNDLAATLAAAMAKRREAQSDSDDDDSDWEDDDD